MKSKTGKEKERRPGSAEMRANSASRGGERIAEQEKRRERKGERVERRIERGGDWKHP